MSAVPVEVTGRTVSLEVAFQVTQEVAPIELRPYASVKSSGHGVFSPERGYVRFVEGKLSHAAVYGHRRLKDGTASMVRGRAEWNAETIGDAPEWVREVVILAAGGQAQ